MVAPVFEAPPHLYRTRSRLRLHTTPSLHNVDSTLRNGNRFQHYILEAFTALTCPICMIFMLSSRFAGCGSRANLRDPRDGPPGLSVCCVQTLERHLTAAEIIRSRRPPSSRRVKFLHVSPAPSPSPVRRPSRPLVLLLLEHGHVSASDARPQARVRGPGRSREREAQGRPVAASGRGAGGRAARRRRGRRGGHDIPCRALVVVLGYIA